MAKPIIQDDISIQLQVQKTVTHEDVRINVSIQAQIDPEKSEADFRKEIHKTLRDFIPGDWKIQNINRQKGNQFEAVYVNATVRVSDKEDYRLEDRAAKVSRIGFELINPRAEYELTFDQIQYVQKELRLMLMEQALQECKAYNETFKANGFSRTIYRISSSHFNNGSQTRASNNAMAYTATANTPLIAATASPMGGASPKGGAGIYTVSMQDGAMPANIGMEETTEAADEGNDDIGVTSRFSMSGTFVLRAVHE